MTDSASPPPPLPITRAGGQGVNRSFASFRCISALILREMVTRYGRSPGGYAWAVLQPMGMILILAVAFSLLVRVPPLGNNFILFMATGLLVFQLYSNVSAAISKSLQYSRALLFYPAVTWIDALLARFILNIITDLLVMLLLFTVLIELADFTLILDVKQLVLSLSLAIALAFGIGSLNSVLFGFFPIWANVWAILNRPMFFISGILFLYENMPRDIQVYLWYNPLVHIVALMRAAFYPTYDATFASPVYVLCWAVIPAFLGIMLMRRYHREILNR